MKKNRIILHCDCNSFFASVETLLNPELKDIPMAVAGSAENRHGIILAKNELAKKYKVETAETIWQAKRKCPDLVCVKPHFDEYYKIYKILNKIYLDYTDLVEPVSIDESYLDVTGTIHLFNKTPKELADSIRERIRTEVGITISVGVSFSKVFAKLGSDYKKPDATTVIMPEDLEKIAYPLPVSDLLFVGKKSTQVLNAHTINTIGDLAVLSREYLIKILGRQGESLWKYFNLPNEDKVRSYFEKTEVKSISTGMTFKRDITGIQEIKCGVSALADAVASRLRSEHKKAMVVQVSIKDPELHTIQRQKKLNAPTHLQKEITDIALELIISNWDLKSPIRLITIGCGELVHEDETDVQLNLFESSTSKNERQEKLEDTMATIRKKYGKDCINYGYSENQELGINIMGNEDA